MVARLDGRFANFKIEVEKCAPAEQAQWWGLAFRYAFYLRNVRGEGKREKQLFYFLFKKLSAIFPKTCCELVSLVPRFGYFKDLDKLIEQSAGASDSSGKALVAASLQCLHKQLDTDVQIVFGKPFGDLTMAEIDTLNSRLKGMTREELSDFTKDMRISLVAKWFSRESRGKAMEDLQSDPRELFVRTQLLSGQAHPAAVGFQHMRLRKLLTALSQCCRVSEQIMCAQPSTGIKRNWADLDPSSMPAGASNKYRKALLNEKIDGPPMGAQIRTGNRYPDRADRVACRQKTKKSVVKGKLKGANLDVSKLSRIIMKEVENSAFLLPPEDDFGMQGMMPGGISEDERALINQQWLDMVADTKKSIDDFIAANGGVKEGCVDPRNIIPIVDTSGSMGAANVQDVAIGLGLLATACSTTPGALISFSDKPEAFMVDLQQDVFEQFKKIKEGPTGFTTNVDKTYGLVLDMMVANKVPAADFALLFLTDGQFNGQLVQYNDAPQDPIRQLTEDFSKVTMNHFQTVFLERMEKAFQDKGYSLPRTVFWNLNSDTPGFQASAKTRGIQLVSGFSQSVMKQVFTGDIGVEPEPEEPAPAAAAAAAAAPEEASTVEAEPLATAVAAEEASAIEVEAEPVAAVAPEEASAIEVEPVALGESAGSAGSDDSAASPGGFGRANVTPWKSFVRTLTSDTFEDVLAVVLATGEGVFGAVVAAAAAPAVASSSSSSASTMDDQKE
jgi:hypothetical protein